MIKKLYTGAFFILLLSASAYAVDDPAASVTRVLDKLEKFNLVTDATSQNQLHNFIKRSIIPHFALKEMSRWISGPYSQHMSEKDRQEFQQILESSLVKIISNNIGSFKTLKSRIHIQPTQYKTVTDAVVATKMNLHNNVSINLDLHMRNIKSTWKIIDVRANGTSALIYYRQHLMPQLRLYNRNKTNTQAP